MNVLFSLEYLMAKTRIEVKQTTRTTQRTHLHRHYLHVYTQHVVVEMVGARHWCSVVLMLGHRRHWRHRFGVSRRPVTRLRLIPRDYTLPHFPNQ